MASGVGGAAPGSSPSLTPQEVGVQQTRLQTPEDRYAMAGGCYAVKAPSGYLVRAGEGFAATAPSVEASTPFHLQATALGRYLLFDTESEFLAASEGRLAETAYGVTRSDQGAVVGGLTGERTDQAADTLADSDANDASGRGASVVSAAAPSDLADWEIDVAAGGFSFVLPETGQALSATQAGALQLVAPASKGTFTFELTQGCDAYPEVEVNVEGPVMGGASSFQEVRGFMDLHLHMMAFEFLGGRARCGRPWHKFGVTHALVDCPDHEPGGHGAVLENLLTKRYAEAHSPDGWPSFEGWPTHFTYTHEQIYYKWLERAWRGGLRLFTNLLVDNGQLCKIYPYKRNSCNEMDGVRLQHQRIYELQDYIDAQSGGPGEGWFRIVKDPFEAREIINQGKLAVVLGIEVSVPLDCGVRFEAPQCTTSQVDERLDEVYDELGVRQMELVNKFDNALSGVTGDDGSTGAIVNGGNFLETGRYWQMDTCVEPEGHLHEHGDHTHEGHMHDRTQYNFHDESGFPDEITGRDALAGGILAMAGKTGAAPVYPEGPHCNQLGLSELGKEMVQGLVERGMIFDPDHMSAKARDESMDIIEEMGHSGVVSSHGWADKVIYPRVYEAGGVVTPHAGGSTSFIEKWQEHRQWRDPRFYFGFGTGADTNGFSAQGAPRGAAAANPVTYPFTGFGGVTVQQQQSGTQTYDLNTDGFAHFGMYPDWIEDLRRQAGDTIVEDMARGPEAYLQMWERSIGVAPNACRSDVFDITDEEIASLQTGMTPRQVLEFIGQPDTRVGTDFTYCMDGGRKATLTFGQNGVLTDWFISTS
jgi:hypothetical protein